MKDLYTPDQHNMENGENGDGDNLFFHLSLRRGGMGVDFLNAYK